MAQIGEEPLSTGMAGGLEKLVGRGRFEDLARIDEPDPVGDIAGETHLMRHADHGHAFRCQALHDRQHLTDHFRIERAGRLVEQHDRWLHGECARYRHPLLLPARQLAGISPRLVGEPNAIEKLQRLLMGDIAATPFTRIGDIDTFSTTERCGKRLKFWNTKPIRLRSRLSSLIRIAA